MMRSINLDPGTDAMLTKYAKKIHVSRSSVVRMLISEKYENEYHESRKRS